jgi:hypothetical protein
MSIDYCARAREAARAMYDRGAMTFAELGDVLDAFDERRPEPTLNEQACSEDRHSRLRMTTEAAAADAAEAAREQAREVAERQRDDDFYAECLAADDCM